MVLKNKFFENVGSDNQTLSRNDPGTMYPTHQCFADAAVHMMHVNDGKVVPLQAVVNRPEIGELLQKLTTAGTPADWQLVHGVIVAQHMKLAHAWVECRRPSIGAMVFETYWFRGDRVLSAHKASEWEKTFKPHRTKRYSAEWVKDHAEDGGDCGPWDKYLDDLIMENVRRMGGRVMMRESTA